MEKVISLGMIFFLSLDKLLYVCDPVVGDVVEKIQTLNEQNELSISFIPDSVILSIRKLTEP